MDKETVEMLLAWAAENFIEAATFFTIFVVAFFFKEDIITLVKQKRQAKREERENGGPVPKVTIAAKIDQLGKDITNGHTETNRAIATVDEVVRSLGKDHEAFRDSTTARLDGHKSQIGDLDKRQRKDSERIKANETRLEERRSA